VSWKDREEMHYTQGFIHEVLRCGGIAGNTLPHKCTADTVIGGHLIPEGRVLVVSYSMQHIVCLISRAGGYNDQFVLLAAMHTCCQHAVSSQNIPFSLIDTCCAVLFPMF